MSAIGADSVLAAFLLFCRIGACLMLMPGFSSLRVPGQVRLYIAIAVTLALTPLLVGHTRPVVTGATPLTLAMLVFTELLTGALVGLLAAFSFLALQFMATAIATYVGFSILPGLGVDAPEPEPSLASVVTIAATLLFFVTDLHWEVLRALVGTYSALPVGGIFTIQPGLIQVADRLSETFLVALRLSGPFVVYGIILNLAIGITNKLTPQIPVYFISLPFVLAGGLFLLYFTIDDMLVLFIESFARWLELGR
ncbi:MAG: flagellar biosynthetic protein FliR [Parvibaculaceae bacterium]